MNNQTQEKKYHTITYGCQMNQSDSERFAGQLKTLGYVYTSELDEADIIVVNTCCVRESAEKKIYGKIGELKRLKAENPNLIIAIAGCMAQKEGDKLFKKAPHVDLVLGTQNIGRMAELVQEILSSRQPVLAVYDQAANMDPDVPTVRNSALSAWVPIMYGCNNFCTYCIVPYVRGRERSRPADDILHEIRELGQEGFREITLLGQNVNSYGKDLSSGMDFADLLTAVDSLETIERVRYMTSHPRDMTDKVIHAIAASQKICEHFHLPVQSGSDTILRQMNRGYTTEQYQQLISRVRAAVPNASLTTDIIVGFPGETDALFEETLAFLQAVRFDAAYTFIYSQRSGTPAAKMAEQIPLAVKKERLRRLMDVQNQISLEINKTLEGKVVEVLAEGPSKNNPKTFTGRTRTNKIVLWERDQEEPGQMVQVEIHSAQTWVLKGKAVQ